MPGDENIQRIHEKMLNDNATAITKFSEGLARLEQQFEGLNSWMKGIAKEIKEFVERNDNKYQTKEMCEMCSLTGEKQYSELLRIYEARIGDIKEVHQREVREMKAHIDKIEQESNEKIKVARKEAEDEVKAVVDKLWKFGIAFGTVTLTAIGTISWFLIKMTVFGVKN